MANNNTLAKVFTEVEDIISKEGYRWVSTENCPEDYFDWGLSYKTTAKDIVDAMLEDGDLEEAV